MMFWDNLAASVSVAVTEMLASMPVLRLGDFTFQGEELPEEIPLGGEQMLAVMQFPGGHKEVQFFGVQESNPVWSGTFCHNGAVDRLRQLDSMYRSGKAYDLRVGSLMPRKAVIKRLQWKYRSEYEISYEIELEIAPTNTNLQSITSSRSDAASGAPAQKTYEVVSGDSLWAIAQKFYGDGMQYRKIADANKIADPNRINVGQRLVIP